MNILYFIVGNVTSYHTQCYFSILSFLSQGEVEGIYIYTDYPEFYATLADRVYVQQLSQERIKEWKGTTDYFWRLKIKTMEDFALKYPEKSFVYMDTDTFSYHSLEPLQQGLLDGKAFMHKNEGDIAGMKFTLKHMWKQVEGKVFAGISFNNSANMWNAGLVALPAKTHLESISLALSICDEMCAAGVTPYFIEQFSFATALNHHYDLQAAEDMVAHYWSNKEEWNGIIADFFQRVYMQDMSFEQIMAALKNFDYKQAPVYKPDNNTKRRLMNLVSKMVREKQAVYLK